MKEIRVLWMILLLSYIAHGQSDGYVAASNTRGLAPGNTFMSSDIDHINLANGALNLHIPLYSRKGRKLDINGYLNYSSKFWIQTPNWDGINPNQLDSISWSVSDDRDFQFQAIGGRLNENEQDCSGSWQQYVGSGMYIENDYSELLYTAFIYRMADGSSHRFPNVHRDVLGNSGGHLCLKSNIVDQGISDDGTMLLDTSQHPFMLYHKDGSKECVDDPTHAQCPSAVITDTNGNAINIGVGPNATDTLGRTFWDSNENPTIKDSNGNTQSYTWTQPACTAGNSQFPTTSENSTPVLQGHICIAATKTLNLPDGRTYTFSFDPTFGEITKIVLPTGGYIRYQYVTLTAVDQIPHFLYGGCCLSLDSRRVSARFVSSTGQSQDEQQWQYSYSGNTTTVTDPLGNVSIHTFATDDSFNPVYEIQAQYYQGSSTLLKTVVTNWAHDQDRVLYTKQSIQGLTDWRITSVTTTLNQSNQVKQETNTYDTYANYSATRSFSNVLSHSEYDWGAGSPGPLLQQTSYTYLHDSYPTYNTLPLHIVDRVNFKAVCGASGCGSPCNVSGCTGALAQTQYEYDNYTQAISPSGAVQHDSGYNASMNYTTRGNVTATSEWRNTDNTWLTTRHQYDDAGNVVSTTDPGNHTTNFSYADLWGNTACQPSGGNGVAYVTQVTNALGHVTKHTYHSCSGTVAATTDPNNQTTSFSYDGMDRTIQANYPDGGQTALNYNGDPVPAHITMTVLASPDPNIVTDYFYDGLGRITRTQLTSDPEGADITDTSYDALGRVYSVSNPYRSGVLSPTDGTTYHAYDALGRETVLTRQDGNTAQTNYSAFPTVVVTDETGRQRQSTTDALGRLVQIVEPNPSSGSLTSGSYPTYYTYDALGNLTYVNQVGDGSAPRTRSFSYDSLSRLLSAYNPESGSSSYGYDADSNLISKTDARGIVATLNYDALHRLTLRTHSDGTPPSDYTYDLSVYACCGNSIPVANSVGRLIHISNDVNAATTYSFDAMGRVVHQSSCIPSYCNDTGSPVTATYDLAGHLTSLTYPSGRKITESYNATGRLLNVNFDSFNGTATGYRYWSVPQSTTAPNSGYTPSGQSHIANYGNGITDTASYNSRDQVSQFITSSDRMFANKLYGWYDGANHNNGNVMSIQDYTSGSVNESKSQYFGYDWLNRITTAWQNAPSGSADQWSQNFSPDPWGNLKQSGSYGFIPNFDTNNRMAGGQGYIYDAAGNLLRDTFHQYTYDAESRIKSIDTNGATYTYGGDGDRIRKDVGSDATEYIYFQGQPIAEYKPATGEWSDYVYANSNRIAKADTFDNYIRIYGTNCMTCGWQDSVFQLTNPWIGYVIQSGDKLVLRQYQDPGSRGGILLYLDGNYVAGIPDQNGNPVHCDTVEGYWHLRSIDLSSQTGKSLTAFTLYASGSTTVQNWNLYFGELAIVRADGTVRPFYGKEANAAISAMWGTANTTRNWQNYHITGVGTQPVYTTTYYHEDHLGTSRLLTTYFGYPIWQGTFLPFGQEWNPQITTNHYKFTGKERDSESMLDYFGARYYSSAMGRWMSPDWADKPEPVPYADLSDPQSLNLYGYVRNNPMSHADYDGHCWPQWLCNTGQRFNNLFHGYGFHTDKGVEDIMHRDTKWLHDNTNFNLERKTGKQIIAIYDAIQSGKNSVTSDGKKFTWQFAGLAPGSNPSEEHHWFPQQYRQFFEDRGIDIDEYTDDLPRDQHRLKSGNGLHARGSEGWNQEWGRWIKSNPNASKQEIMEHLIEMKKNFGVE